MTRHPLNRRKLKYILFGIFGETLHAKRLESLANATTGLLEGSVLGIHAIGRALAKAHGLRSRHTVKQVDRLLSNPAIDPCALFAKWVKWMVAGRNEIVVAVDWTHFDEDKQATLVISMVTKHGRATPLLWKTVTLRDLHAGRGRHEDALLERLRECVPEPVKVTVLADRGFGHGQIYELLKEQLGFEYVVRFRGDKKVVTADGETRHGKDWVLPGGRPLMLRKPRLTRWRQEVPAVVIVKAPAMKEEWCLATSLDEEGADEIVKLYGRRFTIEESFRDQKNLRFGMGLSETHIGEPKRRDRLLMVSALALALLTVLGAAGEALGFDRWLKTNTEKRRTLSLMYQGALHYAALPWLEARRAAALLGCFAALIGEQTTLTECPGLL